MPLSTSTRAFLALGMVTAALAVLAGGRPAHAATAPSADPATVISWDAVTVRTVLTEGKKPPAESQLYFGIVSSAVRDAVTSTAGHRGKAAASPAAAAATAAHDILVKYFPASSSALDADYAATLAAIPAGNEKARGVAAGKAAALRMEQSREGDGRDDAGVQFTQAPATGVWRPTGSAMAPFLVPWLGFVRPLVLDSTAQVPLHGPDALTSRRYARDFAEVKDLGSATSVTRTADQTATALFWSDNVPMQYQAALRDLATRHGFDIVQTARLFALVNTAGADALIVAWRAKFEDPFWRPVTAIALADADGNPATVADPAWKPLLAAPAYPDYPSGHASLTGALTGVLSALFGRDRIDLDVSSAITGTTRHYASADTLNEDTINARVWLGIHFRRADVDANRLGHRVAAIVLARDGSPVADEEADPASGDDRGDSGDG